MLRVLEAVHLYMVIRHINDNGLVHMIPVPARHRIFPVQVHQILYDSSSQRQRGKKAKGKSLSSLKGWSAGHGITSK